MMEAGVNDTKQSETTASHEEDAIVGVQFSPPLYLQRYMLAVEYLTKHSVKIVVDFGCSECGFFRLLSTVQSLQQISLVDIDRDLLLRNSRVISPEVRDYIHRRHNPLKVCMYAGSAGDYDTRFKDCEAITLIEVIEHLEPNILEYVTENVFSNIQPEHVVVTTPNSEFNVLFGNEDPKAFRHWDHKFEWTRQEFQLWCENVCESYGYTVEYSGVGFVPSNQESLEDLGPCSQAAFFRLKKEVPKQHCVVASECVERYELINESSFPHKAHMTVEEKLNLEITYTLRQIALTTPEISDCDDDFDTDGNISVNLCQIANRRCIKELANVEQVRDYFKQYCYQFSDDGESVIFNADKLLNNGQSDDDDDSDGADDNEDLCYKDDLNLNSDVVENCVHILKKPESDWITEQW